MKYLSAALAVAAALTALAAAYEWYRSAKVTIKPTWDIEPGEREDAHEGWTAGTIQAFADSGNFSKRAAGWAITSAVLALSSAAVGFWQW
jgi:hypothetical protein